MAKKYSKKEAKEAAKEMLKGVWTALPTCFTADDKIDAKSNAWNLDYCIDKLGIEGHYFNGNVGEFWAQTNAERKKLAEINVEAAKGRIPLIGGCHHQNPYEAAELCNHARDAGVDFAIILTPYMGARDDDAVFEYYRFVAERTDIGIVLFNIPQIYYPIHDRLAKRLMTIPNICAYKQANPSPAATSSLRGAVGHDVIISVADETPWLHNLVVGGDDWLLNYAPHLYQVPGYTPIKDYTEAALAGDINKAVAISKTLEPIRAVLSHWVNGYGRPNGRLPSHEQKVWMELLGMKGGNVRAPSTPMSAEMKKQLESELAATGILDRVPGRARKAAAE